LFIARWTERGEALSQSSRAREQIHDIDGFWHKGSELVTRQSRIPGKSRISRGKPDLTDIVDARTRSRMMSAIKGKNTKPELTIRRGLHRRGLRYRLHVKSLPGRPDLVLPRFRAALLINGCFWHKHECHIFRWPEKDGDFWRQKLEENAARDARNIAKLREAGWRVLVIWERSVKGRPERDLTEVIDQAEKIIRCTADFGEISRQGAQYQPPCDCPEAT